MSDASARAKLGPDYVLGQGERERLLGGSRAREESRGLPGHALIYGIG